MRQNASSSLSSARSRRNKCLAALGLTEQAVKPAAKGKEGKDHSAKQLNKLDAIYQWGEEGMDEVDGNVMGPSMKSVPTALTFRNSVPFLQSGKGDEANS
jgi:hypothetical protein